MCSENKKNSKNNHVTIMDFIPINKIFEIKVIAKAKENKIYLENNIVKVKVTEVPEDGKANKAIVKLFSEKLKIPKSNIEIISGFTNSIKKIIIKS